MSKIITGGEISNIFHFLNIKYTNPARGILDFCKQKFFGPSYASNETYTVCTPCNTPGILRNTPKTLPNTLRTLRNTPRTLRNTHTEHCAIHIAYCATHLGHCATHLGYYVTHPGHYATELRHTRAIQQWNRNCFANLNKSKNKTTTCTNLKVVPT